jgi:hypothetical protein
MRFLAHNPANLNELAELSAHRVLRVRPERKGLIRRATLCGNDNALLDVARLGGSFLHNRAERWERALEVFITHLRTLFEYELVPSPTSHFAQFPVYDDLTVVLNWRELSIQQAEICWDYKTPDALSLMATINQLISAVAPEVRSTVFYDGPEAYHLERENNALKVYVPLTANIQAGFYAKTSTRLRAEIKYRGNVKQLCRTRIQGHRSFVELFSLVREDAAARFIPIFQSLAAHATTVEPEAQDIAHTLARIAATTEGDEDLLQRIMSILINTGGISELGDDPQRRAIQRLVRDGMLHRLPIRHGGVPRYVLTPNARADLEAAAGAIRGLPATPGNRQQPRSRSVH